MEERSLYVAIDKKSIIDESWQNVVEQNGEFDTCILWQYPFLYLEKN